MLRRHQILQRCLRDVVDASGEAAGAGKLFTVEADAMRNFAQFVWRVFGMFAAATADGNAEFIEA